MIALSTLKYLAAQKFKDSISLFQKDRNAGAVYLMGYAIEFTLKREISITLNFLNGFPETKAELSTYRHQLDVFNSINTGVQLTQITQIRNHKLDELLTFSGAEPKINPYYVDDWTNVSSWNPENRYRIQKFTKKKVNQFIKSSRIILSQIL